MAHKKFTGTGVALATPFNAKEEVDYGSLEKLVEHVSQNSVEYLVVLGTTGETPVLSKQEKQDVASFIRNKNAGKLPLVLGLGGNDTRVVLENIKNADLEGMDAILSAAPYYNKPSQEGLYRHFSLIAEESPIPVILYNVPGRTGCNISAETCLRLAHEYPEKIVAVKEASGNLGQVMQIISKKPESFSIISGDDALTFSLVNLGGDGVISVVANAYPSEFSEMVRLCLNNDPRRALQKHYSLLPAIDMMFEEGSPAGVKAFLHAMGIMEKDVRLPLVPVSEELEQRIRRFVEE